jgi:flagellar hook-length control protein FliK
MTTPAAQTTPTAPGGREPTPSGAPPGAPPEGAPFQSTLETEWARTATAEGQQQSHSESPSSATSRNAPARRARSAGAGASSTVLTPLSPSGTTVAGAGVASSAVAPPAANDPAANVAAGAPSTPAARDASDCTSGLPAPTELEGSSADAKGAGAVPGTRTGAPPAGDSTPVAESPALPASSSTAASGSRFASGGAPTAAGDRGSTSGGDARASDEAPASGGATAHPVRGWVGPDPSTSQSKASPPLLRAPAAAGATLSSTAHTEGAGGGGGSWSSQAGARRPAEQQGPRSAGDTGAHDKLWVPDAAQASPGAEVTSGGVAAGGVGGLAEGSGSAQVSAAPSGGQSELGQQGPLLDYGVGLEQAIETLHGTIQLAARQGLAQARIALEPEGLGEIRIHLTQTAQGLLARVTAETPAAAQALAAAHAELRQSLSSLGLNLARLSVGRHGHSAAQDGGTALGSGGRDGAASSGEASSRGARSGQTAATAAPSDPAPDPEAEEDAQPAPAPARGTLVDVLA